MGEENFSCHQLPEKLMLSILLLPFTTHTLYHSPQPRGSLQYSPIAFISIAYLVFTYLNVSESQVLIGNLIKTFAVILMIFKHISHRVDLPLFCFHSNWQLPVEMNEDSLDHPGSSAPSRRIWQRLSTFLTSNSAIKSASNYETEAAVDTHTHRHIHICILLCAD